MGTDSNADTSKRQRAAAIERRRFFATAARGIESLLGDELRELEAEKIHVETGGVFFTATLETAYRICLWTRLASRVLLPLKTFPALTPEDIYRGVGGIDWSEHLACDATFAVDCNISRSKIKHSRFAALKAKDAVVDQFREVFGVRPSIELEKPDVRINLHLERNRLTVSLDLSGASLHRRGYREKAGAAPLKENLAAAILLLCGWPETAGRQGSLIDPMCGSGTLVIEGALMAMNVAPGLFRDYYGFLGWKGHQPTAWENLVREASSRRTVGEKNRPQIFGFDIHQQALEGARQNARRAGVENIIVFEKHDLRKESSPPAPTGSSGLIVTNPPYGRRLGAKENLTDIYRRLGRYLRMNFAGWTAGILTASPELEKELGLRAEGGHGLFNGSLACRLYHYRIGPDPPGKAHSGLLYPAGENPGVKTEGSEMLANRLRKNLRRLRRWLERENITCYRLYDADIPEYAAAVDIYEKWVHVQEYAPPPNIDPVQAQIRFGEILATLAETLNVPKEKIIVKTRKKQKRGAQYPKLDDRKEFHEVREGGLRFLVNLSDYLDTGLFLDHRPTRQMIREAAAGKLFLNLFGYTGSASVYAAAGGARMTLTVDSSRTYLDWAQKNFRLNGLDGPRHNFVQADCLEWLETEKRRFDLIFVAPPTFSNAKNRKTVFDVRKDYPRLLKKAARLLKPAGTLLFSNNCKKFRMDPDLLPELKIEDISTRTIPPDFQRNRRIHGCWKVTPRPNKHDNDPENTC